jgi:hypothetical protein
MVCLAVEGFCGQVSKVGDRGDRAMSVRAYLGFPGGGKSYGMVEDAYELYRKGYYVFSADYVSFAERIDLKRLSSLDWLLAFDERGAIVLLDELGLLLFSRNFAKNDEALLRTFVLHRKKGIHLFYSAQYLDQVDKVVRELTNERVYCASIGRFYIRFYFSFGTFPTLVKLGLFSKEVFKMYDSYSHARQILKVSKSVKNLIKILRLYERSLRTRNAPVLSSVLRFLLEKAKGGDEDASWLHRELLTRLGDIALLINGGDVGITSVLLSSEEGIVDGSQ